MNKHNMIAVCGATSAIAQATIKEFAEKGSTLLLIARDREKLHAVQLDMETRGAKVICYEHEFGDPLKDEALARMLLEKHPETDTLFLAYGSLPEEKRTEVQSAQRSMEKLCRAQMLNFLSPAVVCSVFAEKFEQDRRGLIAVISSVAGDRGRQSNYVYGSAKGGLSLFLQGVRNRLSPSGVRVLTIKPGFVDTPMTSHIKKGVLFASASSVGRTIAQAMEKKDGVVYVPWFWCWIMLIIKHIPESIFKRLKL